VHDDVVVSQKSEILSVNQHKATCQGLSADYLKNTFQNYSAKDSAKAHIIYHDSSSNTSGILVSDNLHKFEPKNIVVQRTLTDEDFNINAQKESFEKIREVNSILSDKEKKAQYQLKVAENRIKDYVKK
jgi:hypothetical protein